MGKYYAVKNGRETGVFPSWSECEKQVKGFKGAVYKSFSTLEEANDFLDDKKTQKNDKHGLIAYVDGSYNIKTKEYGYGCILIDCGQVVGQYYGKGQHADYVEMRNVAGEIAGSTMAIRYAIEHQYPLICIYYDYEGIEKWATKQWKANKRGTQVYADFVEESRKNIDIEFVKVLAHSGDTFNEMADLLAKKAVGIK